MMGTVTMVASVVPTTAAGAVFLGVVAEAADNPYVSLGVAGVLLAVIVVPTFRWLMARVDRQGEQQEKLIETLQKSVDQSASWQADSRRVHEQLLAAANTTNQLLQGLQRKE